MYSLLSSSLNCHPTDLPYHRSSIPSSVDLELQEPVDQKPLCDYMTFKSDHLVQDISDLHSESDPKVIIKLLYGNALATISDLLESHLKTVKKAAGRFNRLGLHHMAVGEDIIESADSIDSLMSRMSVGGMWDQTRFLRKAIASIPQSAPERGVAEAILFHYNQHLAIYKQATLLKDAIAKEHESPEKTNAPMESNKLVPLKITSPKAFDSFSCEDCYILQVQVLKKAYRIPEDNIICRDVEERQSTTVTFLIPCHYVHDVIQRSSRLDAVWILLELDIIEVSIPGVFTFIPTVGCFLSLLRVSKPFTADLLGVTEVRVLFSECCYLFCFLTLALMPSCSDHCIHGFIHLDELITSVISIPVYQYTITHFQYKWKKVLRPLEPWYKSLECFQKSAIFITKTYCAMTMRTAVTGHSSPLSNC